ncbi:MAG: hypothetical protein Kow0092_23350 [Deferrisomatales bacterium]
MKACTKCPEKHSGAEEALQRRLSCTEVRQYWAGVRRAHRERYGHWAEIVFDAAGDRICNRCKRKLTVGRPTDAGVARDPGESDGAAPAADGGTR